MKPAPSLFLAVCLLGACAPSGPSTGVAAAIMPVMSRCDTAHDKPLLMARGDNPNEVTILQAMYAGAKTCREVEREVAALNASSRVHAACDRIPAVKATNLDLMPLLKGPTARAAKPKVKAGIAEARRAMEECARAVQAEDPGAAAWAREAKARGELPA